MDFGLRELYGTITEEEDVLETPSEEQPEEKKEEREEGKKEQVHQAHPAKGKGIRSFWFEKAEKGQASKSKRKCCLTTEKWICYDIFPLFIKMDFSKD